MVVENISRGRFDQVAPPAYVYVALHAHTRVIRIRPYSTHVEDTLTLTNRSTAFVVAVVDTQSPSRRHTVCASKAPIRPQPKPRHQPT